MEKTINIMYLIDHFVSSGGTENHLTYLATMLNKKKFKCSIVVFEFEENHFFKKLRKSAVPIFHIPVGRCYTYNAIKQAFVLSRLIKENNIDIVQTFHFKSDTYGVLISKLSGVTKIISSRRDIGELKKPRQIFLNKIINRFIDHYIMVCDAVSKRGQNDEKISENKITTIYNGVDLKRYRLNGNQGFDKLRKDLYIGKDSFIIGTVAWFRPEKAYHIFFEGVRNVKPYIKNLKVLVVGDGPTFESCKSYCNQNGLNDIVEFMGYIKEVEKYLSVMDVFCLVPNKNEGFSNAILEAMAVGRPVIATDVGGNAEAVVHNETGIIIPPDNSERLAEAVLELFRDPALRLSMGKKGRKRVEEKFSVEKMIKNHENLYEEVFNYPY